MKRFLQLVLITISVAQQCSFGQTEQVTAAEQGLQVYLKKVPEASKSSYGFDRDDSLEYAYLGKPFNLYTITPARLADFKSGDSINSVISKTDLWYFPVMLHNEIKTILVVDKLQDKWSAVSLGYTPLAGEIEKIIRQWPELKGFNPKIIVVFQADKYLFTIPEIDGYNLTFIDDHYEPGLNKGCQKKPLHKTDINTSRYSILNEISQTIELLKPLVENSMNE